MSDIFYLMCGLMIGLLMRVVNVLLDVAIKEIEKRVPRS